MLLSAWVVAPQSALDHRVSAPHIERRLLTEDWVNALAPLPKDTGETMANGQLESLIERLAVPRAGGLCSRPEESVQPIATDDDLRADPRGFHPAGRDQRTRPDSEENLALFKMVEVAGVEFEYEGFRNFLVIR